MDPEGKDGFPPASEAAGDDISMEAFREWFSKYGGANAMRLLDIDAKYQLWLVGACPLVAGSVNVAQLSADTGLSAGYRMVSSFALVEKVRQLCETKRWPTGKSLRVWTQQTSKASGAVGQRGAADAKPGAIGKEASDDAKTGDASAEDACPAASGGPTSVVPPRPWTCLLLMLVNPLLLRPLLPWRPWGQNSRTCLATTAAVRCTRCSSSIIALAGRPQSGWCAWGSMSPPASRAA